MLKKGHTQPPTWANQKWAIPETLPEGGLRKVPLPTSQQAKNVRVLTNSDNRRKVA